MSVQLCASDCFQDPVTYRVGGDVRQIGRDTGGVDDIVQGELVNQRGELEEKGQRLSNTARGASNDCRQC
jgi:hypothetical protein